MARPIAARSSVAPSTLPPTLPPTPTLLLLPPPPLPAPRRSTHRYRIDFDQELVQGNVSKGIGRIRGSLSVTFGEGLIPALEQACV